MPGILWFLFWQSLGCAISFRFFRSRALLVRLWLGSTAGSVLSMWAPVPFAFLWGFSVPAHAAAAAAGALLAAWLFLAKRAQVPCISASEGADPGAVVFDASPILSAE